jgi:hypothetical protein
MLAYEITRLVDINYSKMYNVLKPKIDFNYNRVMEIAYSLDYIPDMIKERHKEFESDGEVVGVDGRFDEMIRRLR